MKQPYREPEPIHIDPPPKDLDYYFDRYAGKGLFVLITGFACAAGYSFATHVEPPPPPCSSFANTRSQDVPARCTKTYNPDGGPS